MVSVASVLRSRECLRGRVGVNTLRPKGLMMDQGLPAGMEGKLEALTV